MTRAVNAILILLAVGLLVLAGVVTRDAWFAARDSTGGSEELIIFHAGSLAVPFQQICEEFSRAYPRVKIVREAGGSRICARKIADLHRPCDVMASADYTVIDSLLIPEHARWNIRFASNEMVIAYRPDSRRADQINANNWFDVLLEPNVTFGRSDPNADPCGYRTILTMMLAEKLYDRQGLAGEMLEKDRKHIRPKEVELLALMETSELDYLFIYRSVAEQHKLEYLVLPDEINLKKVELSDFYRSASVRLTGKKPGTFITKVGEPIIYGVTIPANAPNRKLALAFVMFLLDVDKGGAILEKNGQTFVVPSPTDTFDRLPECLKEFALAM